MKIALTLLILGLILAGCAPAETNLSNDQLVIATNYWPGKFWIHIADEKGWFEEEGLNVTLVTTFDDYYGSIQDTADGKNDVNGMSLFDLMNYNIRGAEFVMIVNTDNSATSDALVVREGIQTVADLAGKKIAVSTGYYTDYLLDVVLAQHRMTDNDIIKISGIQDEHMANAFKAGSIDGFLSWQPGVSDAVNSGGHVLWDASHSPGIAPNGQVVTRTLIDERPEAVQAYVNVWHRTTQWMNEHQEESMLIISAEYGFPVEEVKRLYESETLPDLKNNRKAFLFATDYESLHGVARQMNAFLINKGITDQQLDSTAFLDARFIRGVNE